MKSFLRRRLGVVLVAGAVLGFWSAPRLSAQQEDPYRFKKPLEHQVSVILKLIQASVTDRKGNPLSDLTLDDFVVYDNGKRVILSAFEKYTVTAPAASKQTAAPVPVQAAETPAKAPEPAAPSITRKFLLFFDFAFNTPKGVEKAMIAARHFLDDIVKPDDEIGLASFSLLKGMKIHEFFTADHPKIRQAISDISVKSAAGRFEDMEAQYWSQLESHQMNSDSGVRGTEDPMKMAKLSMERSELRSQVQLYLSRLVDLAQAFRYVTGQKNLIVFSTGIPNSLISGTGLGGAGNLGDTYLRVKVEETMRQLSSANIAYFSFDTREQAKRVDLFRTDEETLGNQRVGRDMNATESFNLIGDDKLTGRNTLERFADITGGKYFGNIREYEKSLDQVQTLTGTFYVLGYTLDERGDGEYHEIKVETKRKGAVVHAQTGYFNPKPFAEYSALEKDLHLFDLAYSEKPQFQTPLTASLTTLAIPVDTAANLVFLAKLPPETVEKMSEGKTEIVTFVFDEAGGLADLRRSEQILTAYAGRTVLIASGSKLAPGSYKCRIVARNLVTGTAATASIQAFVPKAPGPGLFLQKPLLLLPSEAAVYLQIQNRDGTAARWMALYPFDANQYTPELGPIAKGTAKIIALLPCMTVGIEAPQVRFRVAAVDGATGKRTELPARSLDTASREGIFAQTLEVSVGRLAAGKYALYFYVEEAGTKSISHAVTPLVIR